MLIPSVAAAQTMTEYIIIVAMSSKDFGNKTSAVEIGNARETRRPCCLTTIDLGQPGSPMALMFPILTGAIRT